MPTGKVGHVAGQSTSVEVLIVRTMSFQTRGTSLENIATARNLAATLARKVPLDPALRALPANTKIKTSLQGLRAPIARLVSFRIPMESQSARIVAQGVMPAAQATPVAHRVQLGSTKSPQHKVPAAIVVLGNTTQAQEIPAVPIVQMVSIKTARGSQVAKIVAVGSTKMARLGVVAWSVPRASTKPKPEKLRAINVERGTTNPAKGKPGAPAASKANTRMRMAPQIAIIVGSVDTAAQGGCRRLAAAGLAKLVISVTVAAPPIHRQIALRGKRRSRIRKEQSTTAKKVKRVGSWTVVTTRYQREMRTWITGKHNFRAPINITASMVLPSQSCCGPPAMAVHLMWLGKS